MSNILNLLSEFSLPTYFFSGFSIRNLLPLQDLYMGLEKTAAHDWTSPASCRCAPINEHNWLCLCLEIILLLTRLILDEMTLTH
ncbi:hypothetical protein T11_14006 [Trichinella zimbabwensis]|uniref:Uncharacterized protein n=1 Tax=Trichinella zimbabwensis TaxID=268475 RepID=A0A0V1GYY1_9BILA|nr:hypothetical protein T11_14006 [Trichinella zimbabwensis]